MNDHLFGCMQGFIIFFVLCLGIVIGWYSRGNTEKEEKMKKLDIDEGKEADAYVRDHLLIEWMLEFLCFDRANMEIEWIYNEWKTYISEREAEHAKRSTI